MQHLGSARGSDLISAPPGSWRRGEAGKSPPCTSASKEHLILNSASRCTLLQARLYALRLRAGMCLPSWDTLLVTLHRGGLSFSRIGWLLLVHRKEAFHSWSVVSSSCEDIE